jgi:hypothetical protein
VAGWTEEGVRVVEAVDWLEEGDAVDGSIAIPEAGATAAAVPDPGEEEAGVVMFYLG